ncbi:MAG: AMP-binding protein, partial [Acidimicrobiia bacterium]|nr:AMP-binding protein [Acidimicrobiia bacterium]
MTLHPSHHGAVSPHSPAIITGTGETVTYAELCSRANRIAHLLRSSGVATGDHVAILLDNRSTFLEIAWAAQSSGLVYTPINRHLTQAEVQHMLDDCGAKVLFTSDTVADVAGRIDRSRLTASFMTGTAADGFESLDDTVRDLPTTAIADPCEGTEMLYSGGTTGAPKGVRKELRAAPLGDAGVRGVQTAQGLAAFGMDDHTVYLSPAPLYHAAPLVYCMAVHRMGGTVVIMERFDAEQCLALIDRHRVTHAQFVPTMFSRLLRVPDPRRQQFDGSSLQMAIHSAAPCPVEVKRQMIGWWGPILFEYYSGTEDIGFSAITSEEWLAHPGSVGRPMSPTHIVGDDGHEWGPGEPGVVYFESNDRAFAYHNDPDKTAAITDHRGWRTLGDVGYLDDGYLFLTDRVSHMIISGGVNI